MLNLPELKKEQFEILRETWGGAVCIFKQNKISRAIIRRMKRINGAAYIYKVNLYGDERGDRGAICTKYTRGRVYNFSGAFILPEKNVNIIELILSRDTAEYTGTKDDAAAIDRIYDAAEKAGAILLFWQ